MIQYLLPYLFCCLLTGENPLIGRWANNPSEKGNVTTVVFRPDNSLEGFINKKPFTSGKYTFSVKDSVIQFTDNGCNGWPASYKVLFFHQGDSLKFKAIGDSCGERKAGMERLVMGRVKAAP